MMGRRTVKRKVQREVALIMIKLAEAVLNLGMKDPARVDGAGYRCLVCGAVVEGAGEVREIRHDDDCVCLLAAKVMDQLGALRVRMVDPAS